MKINKDYILALVEEITGKLVKRQFAIKSQDLEILKAVQDVFNREGFTVIDLSDKRDFLFS